ncbi:MAG: OprD family outer membrane porin [Bacteroidia bacterium]
MNRIQIILVLIFSSIYIFGQDSLKYMEESNDTMRLKDLFLKGKLDINTRTTYMTTINDGSLKDDYALATGVGIGLTTKLYRGFQAGISSFVTYNLWSSNLTQPDKLTLAPNRYEIGLFDVQNLSAKNNLIRIENLFVRYSISKTSLTIGRMKLNTPFLNPQDGRMNVTMEEGAWLSANDLKKIHFNGGWFWNISPRSTTQWYTTAGSIGLYPSGVTETGTKSNYFGNISSRGVAIGNISILPNKKIKLNLWDMFIDNIMNTAMIEMNTEFGKKMKYYQGAMYIHQDALNYGGNVDQTKTYAPKGSQSNAISVQTGIKNKKFNFSLNYTHITGDGQYLAPREWGRDPFYTFMLREKNDGFGNVHSFTTKITFYGLDGRIKTGLAYGFFQLPDVQNYRLNKYGMPSYHQVNFDFSYSFSKFLKGFDIRFITAYKLREGETYNNPKYIYNKVNMANISLILDFKM